MTDLRPDETTPATTMRLPSNEGSIAFDDTGGFGPLVIAIPGMGDLRGEYRFLKPQLAEAGYRVVTMDVRGHGETSASWSDYSAHAVASDVLGLIRHLGRESAVLIGNSFSAGSAMWAVHDAPAVVSGVVMIGPILRDPKNLPWYVRAFLAVGLGGPWRVSFWMTYWSTLFPKQKPGDFKQYRARLAHNLREPGRMAALKRMIYLSKSDTEAMLSRVDKPLLLVMGTKDPDFTDPADEAKWIAERTGASVIFMESAGHYPQTEMPREFGSAVIAFLKEAHL